MADADVHALLADSTLLKIATTTLSASRVDNVAGTDEELSVEPQYTLHTGWRDDEQGFRVALHTEVRSPIGNIRCDVQAEYELTELSMSVVPSATMEEFVNNVALMTVIPYIRQGIADISLRVFESPLLMPMIKRGEIVFSFSEDPSGPILE